MERHPAVRRLERRHHACVGAEARPPQQQRDGVGQAEVDPRRPPQQALIDRPGVAHARGQVDEAVLDPIRRHHTSDLIEQRQHLDPQTVRTLDDDALRSRQRQRGRVDHRARRGAQ